MERYRIGFDLTVLWSITDRNGVALPLGNKEVHLYYTNGRGRYEAEISIQDDNVIVWHYYGRDQRTLGSHTLTVEIIQSEGKRNIRKDISAAFVLVGRSCEDNGEEMGDALINEGGEITLATDLDIYRIQPVIPEIHTKEDGQDYWFIDGVDTGKPARGEPGGNMNIVGSEEQLYDLDLPGGSIAAVVEPRDGDVLISEMESGDQVLSVSYDFPEGPDLNETASVRFEADNLEIILAAESDAVTATYVRSGVQGETQILADYSVAMPSVNPDYLDALVSEVANAEGGLFFSDVAGSAAILDQFFSASIAGENSHLYQKSSIWEKVAKVKDLESKQNTISDLETIRSGAAKGATAVQPDDLSDVATSGSYNDLSDKPVIDTALSSSSTNAVQNKVVNTALAGKQSTISDLETIRDGASKGATAVQPESLSNVATSGDYNDLTNKPAIDIILSSTSTNAVQNKVVTVALAGKQETLVSGTNIKTLNGEDLLGSGNIELDLSEYAKQADLETLTDEVISNEKVTAAALNDLNDKIAEVEAGAQTITIDSDFSTTSENPVQNKVITAGLSEKQDTLVSGTSIKTINGESLLGSGNLVVVTDLSECATKAEVTAVSDTVAANKTAADNAVSALSEAVTANKTAADDAISALDTRVGNAEASLALCATKTEVETLTTEIIANEQVTAAALNDLNDKITEIIARLDALSA